MQECLLLQIKRRPNDTIKPLMQKVITECFDEFTKKHFDKIRATLGVDVDTAERVQAELRRLNPKPGSSFGLAERRA
ncbi:hypothetical protein VSS86_20860, partial [Bacillus safensis]|nr:hypothetical protein [Bacillus safensis]